MSIINFLLSLLDPIAKLFNKYGVLKALGYIAIILFFGIILYSGWTMINLDKRIDKGIKAVLTEQTEEKDKEHAEGINKRFANMEGINSMLRESMYISGADRACILEMHNGTNNTAGLPFIYCEMTYEQVKEGVLPVDDNYARLNLTRYTFPYYLMQNEYYCGDIKQGAIIDSKICTKMSLEGTGYIAIYQLKGDSGVLGYFALTWNEGTPVNFNDSKFEQMSTMARKFGNMLDQ